MLAPDRWLKRGWRAFVLNAGAFVGGMLILAIGSAATAFLLFIPLGMGLIEMALPAGYDELTRHWPQGHLSKAYAAYRTPFWRRF